MLSRSLTSDELHVIPVAPLFHFAQLVNCLSQIEDFFIDHVNDAEESITRISMDNCKCTPSLFVLNLVFRCVIAPSSRSIADSKYGNQERLYIGAAKLRTNIEHT